MNLNMNSEALAAKKNQMGVASTQGGTSQMTSAGKQAFKPKMGMGSKPFTLKKGQVNRAISS